MIGNNQVCGICNLEASNEGCLCDGALILLCSICSRAHFNDKAKDHNFIELELASRMWAEPLLVRFYLEEKVKIVKLLKVLRDRSNKTETVKRRYMVYKQKLVSCIEEIFYKLIGDIEEITTDYRDKIKILNTYKSNLYEEGRCLIEEYQSKGIRAIVRNTIEGIDIPIDEVLEYLTNILDPQRSSIRDSSIISERDRIFNSLMSEIEEKKQENEFLSKAYKNQILDIEHYKNQISNLYAEINELTSVVMFKDDQLVMIRKDLEEQLSKRDKIINDFYLKFQHKINNLDGSLFKLRGAYFQSKNSMYSRILELKKACNQSHEEIKGLNLAVQRLQKELATEALLSSTDRAYIYTPSNYTKSIVQYDIKSEKVKVIDIPSLSRNFIYASSCTLPNGDVFLAGFPNPISSEVYLYKIASKEIVTLPPLSYPRYLIGLFYYRSYVYSFGGVNSNCAERYSLINNSWEPLHDMKYQSSSLSCVGIDDKIYLFRGGHDIIEVFDTTSLNFEVLVLANSDSSSSDRGVAYRVNDRVYLLTDNLIQIYDTRLTKLAVYTNRFKYFHVTLSNIITCSDSIYYYNSYTLNVERIDIALPMSGPQVYSHDPNRFIYKVREKTKVIQRIDLEHSTIEHINLSTVLDREFSSTSLCVLGNGEVLLAGFGNPASEQSYLFTPKTESCIKLPDLNYPRYNTSLIYHKNCVYGFGGMDHAKNRMKSSENINIVDKKSWIILPDMIQARTLCSCIGMDDKIYIIGGGHSSIEIYSLKTNSYQLAEISLSSFLVVSVMIEDRIHIIGKKNYTILTCNLETVADYRYNNQVNLHACTMGNIVCYKERIYFYNQLKQLLERVNSVNFDREVHFLTHRRILI
jgi:hypothetical protein